MHGAQHKSHVKKSSKSGAEQTVYRSSSLALRLPSSDTKPPSPSTRIYGRLGRSRSQPTVNPQTNMAARTGRRTVNEKIEEYNRKVQLTAFHLSGTLSEGELAYEGVVRFYLDYGDSTFTKAIRLTNDTTWATLKPELLDKFNLTEGVRSGRLVPLLYAEFENGESSLRADDRPLVLALDASANVKFTLKVFEKDNTSSPLKKEPVKSQSQSFFQAMKKKLRKTPSNNSVDTKSLKGSPSASRNAATPPAREPIGPISIHDTRRKSDSSVGSKASKRKTSSHNLSSSDTRSLISTSSRSNENLSRAAHRKKKGQVQMQAIDNNNEFITIHGDRSVIGVDEVIIPVTPNTAARDLVADVLEECGISLTRIDDFVIKDVIGRSMEGLWITDYSRNMNDSEQPLLLISMMRPSEGLIRRFEIRSRDENLSDKQDFATHLEDNASPGSRRLKRQTSQSLSSISNNTDCNLHPLKFPTNCPYLLTVQSFDPQYDSVIYLLCEATSIVGSAVSEDACQVHLFSSDIQPQHCSIVRKPLADQGHVITVVPFPDSLVLVNDVKINSETDVKQGDVIAMGNHYIFIFKDPILQGLMSTSSTTLGRNASLQSQHGTQENWQDMMADNSVLNFAPDQANIVIENIINASELDEKFPLAPSYLLLLSIQRAQQILKGHELAAFITKVAQHLQLAVQESVQNLQNKEDELKASAPSYFLVSTATFRSLIHWLANCAELRSHIANLYDHLLTAVGETDTVDNTVSAVITLITDAVTFAFQQAVYHLTKVLYPTLDLILTDNPFNDMTSGSPSMQDTLHALSDLLNTCTTYHLNSNISTQLFQYLYFFIGTSLCNKIYDNEAGTLFYTWEEGVLIRKNLELLEIWAGENDLESISTYLSKCINVAEFLATSKQFLLQASWSQFRNLYPQLSPSQLRHLLDNYNLGNKPTPIQWDTVKEDSHAITTSQGILESFDDHPPLSLPGDTRIDITDKSCQAFLMDKISVLNALFNTPASEDDEVDSGFDACQQAELTVDPSYSREQTTPNEERHNQETVTIAADGQAETENNAIHSPRPPYTPKFKKRKNLISPKQAGNGDGKEIDGDGKEIDGDGKEIDGDGKEIDGDGKEIDDGLVNLSLHNHHSN